MESNFRPPLFESRLWRLTFLVQNRSGEGKFDQNAGKFVIYKFWLIT